jgi:predicted metal-dependent hydrolase
MDFQGQELTQTKLDWSSGALAEGLRCYRCEEFFLAHEHWESVWLKSSEPEKTFLQALIQMAGALHHFRRSNRRGATSLLKAALRRLDLYTASFQGVEVAPLRDEVRAWLQALEIPDAPIDIPVPEIRVGG